MPPAYAIILTCWLIFLFYWLISWRSVKPSLETKLYFGRLHWIIIVTIASILLAKNFNSLTILIPSTNLSPLLQIISILQVTMGLIIAIIARKKLGGNWSGKIGIKKNHRLITSGIYKYIRHPIYTGVLSMTLGTFMNFRLPGAAILFLFIFSLLLYKLKKEEVLLAAYFPKEYPAYAARTKSLIPFIY